MTCKQRYAASLMNTFGPPKLVLVRGEGAHVWDDEGNEYVDLLGGIAVNALGHAHPALVEAVTTQLHTLGHVSNFFTTEPQVALAEKLLSCSLDAAGATAGQGLLHQLRRRGQRGGVQAHPAHRPHPPGGDRGRLPRPHDGRPRADLQGGLPRALRAAARRRHLRAVRRRRRPRGRGDRRDRRRACSSRCRARPGSTSPPTDYLAAARARSPTSTARCSGSTRCRPAWAAPAPGSAQPAVGRRRPDVVTLAKGLAGGLPDRRLPRPRRGGRRSSSPGNHGTTFGGNPVACAAALAVIDTIERDGSARARRRGGRAAARPGWPTDARVVEVRGSGLLIGLDLVRAARPPTWSRPPSRPASSSTRPARTGSGSRRRWCSPTTTPTRSWPRGRRSSTRRTRSAS